MMIGINRATRRMSLGESLEKSYREKASIDESDIPCIFISYQRNDEDYAKEISDYVLEKKIDVYFDLAHEDLRIARQEDNPMGVTTAIRQGLLKCSHMLVIVSPGTLESPWVPFEIGYAYDRKGEDLKVLRHKGIDKTDLPQYLKVKEVLNGTLALNGFLESIQRDNWIYESVLEESERIKMFAVYGNNPLSKYLDNE